MKVAFDLSLQTLVAALVALLVGAGVSYGVMAARETALKEQIKAAATPVKLDCGNSRYVLPQINATDEIRAECSQLSILMRDMSNSRGDLNNRTVRLTCLGLDGQQIGNAMVDSDKIDQFNATCSKYQDAYNQLPQETPQNPGAIPPSLETFTPPNTSPVVPHRNMQAMGNLRAAFMGEAAKLSSSETGMRAMQKKLRDAETSLSQKISAAGGGTAINDRFYP